MSQSPYQRAAHSVRRFLVTGTDDQITDFHMRVGSNLNAIERRGQTVFYTCVAEDAAAALSIAGEVGVIVQEWDEEKWRVIVGAGPGWQWFG